jgi:hypothetical protein
MEAQLMQTDKDIESPTKDNQAQKERVDNLSYPQWMPRGLFKAIGPISLFVLVIGAAVGFYAHEHVTKDSVRFQFWIGFMFSFLAFVVLLVQSVIYAQQAEFMKQQSKSMRDTVERTDKMIENMQGQLTSMVNQEQAMLQTAQYTRQMLDETHSLVIQNAEMVKAMKGQLKQTEIQVAQNERAVKIAEENANIAKDGLVIAQRSAEQAQRACVTVTKREFIETGFNLTIENSGNTPALEVAVDVITDVGFTPPEPPKEISLKSFTHIGLMAPHSRYEMFVPCEKVLTEEDQRYINDPQWGNYDWWCKGTISYRDIFQPEEGEYHETDFCFYYDRPRRKVQAWVQDNAMKIHRVKYPEWYKKPN